MTESLLDPAPEPAAQSEPAPETAPAAEPIPLDQPADAERPPETPEQYDFPVPEALAADPEINRRLHAAGLTNSQAALVYELAAEVLVPMVGGAAAELEAERQTERLAKAFGGEARWREASRQILAWGQAKLKPDMLHALSTTYEGVMALKQMMASDEPGLLAGGAVQPPDDEQALRALMNDPRYWRDRDPKLVNQVEEGFRRLFGDAR